MRSVAIVVIMLVVTVPAFGDQSSPDPKAAMRFGALRQEQSNGPYKQLFEAQEALKAAVAQQQAKAVSPKSKVVCGMTIIAADPSVDPKMNISPPKDPKVRYTIHAVEPPVCFDRTTTVVVPPKK